jgi:hypothetical protein
MDHSMPSQKQFQRIAIAALLPLSGLASAGLPTAAAADGGTFTATLATFVDDADGISTDVDLYWDPADWIGLSAGIGQAESSSELADLDGDALRAGIDLRGESLGGRLNWRRWQDGGQFESDTLGGEIYWRATSGWQFGLIAEQRDFSVDYTVTVLNRPITRRVEFDGQGFGAQASWYGEAWGGYLRGVSYDYGDTLARVRAAAQTPNLGRFPRIQALVASLLTRTAGAVDHDLSAGIERSFQRSGLRLDVSTTRDALSAAESRTLSLSYRYALTPRFELEGTLGTADSDDLDSVGFAGLALSLRQ